MTDEAPTMTANTAGTPELPAPPRWTNETPFPAVSRLDASEKAQVLVEALPWLQRFAGATVVVKYGGHAMTNDALRLSFARDILFLRTAGLKPVVVHGGGPQINEMLTRVGIDSEFRGGLRVTTEDTMDVVRMVLTGKVQRELVSLLNRGMPGEALAVGLSGEDSNLFTGRRRTATVAGKEVDVGHVGDVTTVHPGVIRRMLDGGLVPVVSTIAVDEESRGEVLNVNADTAAAALAVALEAEKLIVLTDVSGLYARWPDPDSLLFRVSASEVREMLPNLAAGMVPKMEACLRAVDGGVPGAHIVDGRLPHAVMLEIFTPDGIGTMVRPDQPDQTGASGRSGRPGQTTPRETTKETTA